MASITKKRLNLHQHLQEKITQNKNLENQLLEQQSLTHLGTASCMIAHEINNLLTPLYSYADLALKHKDDPALTEKALQKTIQNCERITKVMESMLAMANGKKQKKEVVKIKEMVEQVFDCLCRDFAKDGITVDISIEDNITAEVVPVQIQQVIMNLVLNARDAMLERGGILAISAVRNPDTIELHIKDSGLGIEQNVLKNLFESFITTKTKNGSADSTSGTGLGLAFCKKVIESHDGFITVESEPGNGTKFKIILPGLQTGKN